jgi:3-isopropylmalate/(R)-2-methylmalate dehydratase large subunit
VSKTLFQKIWEIHKIKDLNDGSSQLFIGLHLIHEVTSPQAFFMLDELKMNVLFPERNFATCDHIIPTDMLSRPFCDPLAEEMLKALEINTKKHKINFFNISSGLQGIIHVIGPELGITRPGMVIACGDSHTATHGAFGSIAFGIGTSQVRNVLATQSLIMAPLNVRKIEVNGVLNPKVYAKDIILYLINKLTTKGGLGFAYEFSGSTIEELSMEGRLTLCNMAIEGGARVGYVNPDQKTYDYLKNRLFSPKGEDWNKSLQYWESIKTDKRAQFDDIRTFNASDIQPMVTWGITPEQAISVTDRIPEPVNKTDEEALEYMHFKAGEKIEGKKIDKVFIGSCTNGRIEDLREVAETVKGEKVHSGIKAIIVPGSTLVKKQAEDEGLHHIFIDAGFEWRMPGCSMCLAMNPDKLIGDEICVSTSNRNFKGRQGSPVGRTILASPATAAASAIAGEVIDVRKFKGGLS